MMKGRGRAQIPNSLPLFLLPGKRTKRRWVRPRGRRSAWKKGSDQAAVGAPRVPSPAEFPWSTTICTGLPLPELLPPSPRSRLRRAPASSSPSSPAGRACSGLARSLFSNLYTPSRQRLEQQERPPDRGRRRRGRSPRVAARRRRHSARRTSATRCGVQGRGRTCVMDIFGQQVLTRHFASASVRECWRLWAARERSACFQGRLRTVRSVSASKGPWWPAKSHAVRRARLQDYYGRSPMLDDRGGTRQ